jgi:antitoxin PrlF
MLKSYTALQSNTIQRQLSMATNLTSKGQVTIPKKIRDALNLRRGTAVEFTVNPNGEVVLNRAVRTHSRRHVRDRFDAARGRADVKWRTDELMKLLRGNEP